MGEIFIPDGITDSEEDSEEKKEAKKEDLPKTKEDKLKEGILGKGKLTGGKTKKQEKTKTEDEKLKEEIIEKAKAVEEEKKTEAERGKEAKTKKPVKKKRIPFYLIILFIFLGAATGAVIHKVFLEELLPIVAIPETEPVKLILLYSSECGFCEKENSIKFSFQEKKVLFEEELIDVSKEENRHYIEEFNVGVIPTALVERETAMDYPDIFSELKNNFPVAKGFFVVPELYLDGLPHTTMLLKEVEECSGGGKPVVHAFLDYVSPASNAALEGIDELNTEFGYDINFTYRNFPVNGIRAENAAAGAECARMEGYRLFNDWVHWLFKRSFPGDGGEAIDVSDKSVMLYGAMGVMPNNYNSFKKCLDEDWNKMKEKVKEDYLIGAEYGMMPHAGPYFVIDCSYILVGTNDLKEVICDLHPELEECS